MRVNATARLVSDATALVAGTVAAVVTARYLGPAGKGNFSVLTYVGGLVAFLATVGVGDAAVFFVNRRRYTFGAMARAAALVTAVVSTLAAVVSTALLWAYLAPAHDPQLRGALVLFAVSVPVSAVTTVSLQFHHIYERFRFTSFVTAAMAATSAGALWVLLGPLDGGLRAAMAATVLTTVAGCILSLVAHLRWSRDDGGVVDRPLIRAAVRYGAAVVAATALTSLAGRADLVVVHGILTDADAGIYSVGLTISSLPVQVAVALALVGFPRQSRSVGDAFVELTARLCRVGVLGAGVAAAAAAAVTPFAVPVLFGPEFTAAVVPTLLLLLGALPWSFHFVLGRAAAAAGHPAVLSKAYLVSTTTMLVLDVLVIPWGGIIGAAVASSLAPLTGSAVLLRWWVGSPGPGGRPSSLLPRPADVLELGKVVRDLVRRRAG